MQFANRSKTILWTHHARAKMNFYKLSEARVLRVLNSPKRIEDGVAPKTVAMMQPTSLTFKIDKGVVSSDVPHPHLERGRKTQSVSGSTKETWTQEIWVMTEDSSNHRTIISAWRYPGKTKPRSEISLAKMREEYRSFVAGRGEKDKRSAAIHNHILDEKRKKS